MNNIKVLDCTLRDGGYCNQWRFGNKNAKKILRSLVEADIDIIECGFITRKVEYDSDMTRYPSIKDAEKMLPLEKKAKMFVCMINYGEFSLEDIPECDDVAIDGIRVAFHKKDMLGALELCRGIKEKGYKLFMQPMVSLNYSDQEFLNLIQLSNEISPYAFYIVDSFGAMKRKDLIHLFYMADKNLSESIQIGFHSHNNMQLAYSNAQVLVEMSTKRNLVIDSCIFGMGRGAGNLNTEIFVGYLNDTIGSSYFVEPLLVVIDEILNIFYKENYWGYSLSNYLSAFYNIHPNYAGYLDDKKTLTFEKINEIFAMIDDNKKFYFDKEYIETLYLQYMSREMAENKGIVEFREKVKGKKVLLIAPGASAEKEKDKLQAFATQEDVVTISVNFAYPHIDTDYIFVSNLRRFQMLDKSKKEKCIVTSNLSAGGMFLEVEYKDLLNDFEMVRDNAGLMAIKFLIACEIDEIYLAGFDGYSHDYQKNYGDAKMAFVIRNEALDAMNKGFSLALKEFSKNVKISYLTERRHK